MRKGHISFWKHFKYFGSYISYSMKFDHGIELQLISKNQQWETKNILVRPACWPLQHIFNIHGNNYEYPAVGMHKLGITIQLAMLPRDLLHQSIKNIMDIIWEQVRNKKLRNKTIRNVFTTSPQSNITLQQDTYLFWAKYFEENTPIFRLSCLPHSAIERYQ